MKLKPATQHLYVRSMGKLLRVTAIFDNDEDANKYMEKTADEATVACFGRYVLIASMYDHGEVIKGQFANQKGA